MKSEDRKERERRDTLSRGFAKLQVLWPQIILYRIAGNFGMIFNLVIWVKIAKLKT